MGKNPAAVALGKERWKGKTEQEKAAHVQMMNNQRMVKTTHEERSERARAAVQVRWAKARKKGRVKKNG